MKSVILGLALSISFCSLAQAKAITVPVNLDLKSLFTAGTNTYLGLYASPELDKQIESACGSDAILLSLDVHYTVKKVAGDVSDAELTGSATCQTRGD